MLREILLVVYITVSYDHLRAEPLKGIEVREVEKNEFPFIVSIQEKLGANVVRETHHSCGGTLISRNHVLTAAHCLPEKEHMKSRIEVHAGTHDLTSPDVKKFKVASWKDYNTWAWEKGMPPTFSRNDIAVILLDVDDTGITPAKLLPVKTIIEAGTRVQVAGWGLDNCNTIPSTMNKLSSKVLSYSDCINRVKRLRREEKITNLWIGQFCYATEPYAFPDCGDSGDPVLNEKMYVIGVHTSRAATIGPDLFPLQVSIGVKVNHYRKFIEDVIKSHEMMKKKINHNKVTSTLMNYIAPTCIHERKHCFEAQMFWKSSQSMRTISCWHRAIHLNQFQTQIQINMFRYYEESHARKQNLGDIAREMIRKVISTIPLRIVCVQASLRE